VIQLFITLFLTKCISIYRLLEKKIAIFDLELSEPGGYERITSQEGRFETYENNKVNLDQLFEKWEKMENELDKLTS